MPTYRPVPALPPYPPYPSNARGKKRDTKTEYKQTRKTPSRPNGQEGVKNTQMQECQAILQRSTDTHTQHPHLIKLPHRMRVLIHSPQTLEHDPARRWQSHTDYLQTTPYTTAKAEQNTHDRIRDCLEGRVDERMGGMRKYNTTKTGTRQGHA